MGVIRVKKRRKMTTAQILILGFLCVILIGASLLHLPLSSRSGASVPFADCVFTAVSATCVTGLVVTDTALTWSGFGQAVILLMIQIGGLGFMTLAVMLSNLMRRRVSARERVILANSYNLISFEGLLPFVRRIFGGTLLIELCGAGALSFRFIPLYGWGKGIWRSVFHSVSAFCNAGFDLMGGESGGEPAPSCVPLVASVTLSGCRSVVVLYEVVDAHHLDVHFVFFLFHTIPFYFFFMIFALA